MDDMVMDYLLNGYLAHHGIKGQKWGVRRYQNYDGTLKSAGKKRYGQSELVGGINNYQNRDGSLERSKKLVNQSSNIVAQLSKIEKETRPKPKSTRKMDLSQMTDEELRKQVNRKLLEQQYNKLFSEQSPVTVSKGRKFVQDTLDTANVLLGFTGSALSIALAIQKLKSA